MEIKSKESKRLAACPFCGGSARVSRRQMRYYGTNARGEMKIRLGVQAICCRCKARGPLYAATVIVPGSESHIEWMEDRAAAWWSAWKEHANECVVRRKECMWWNVDPKYDGCSRWSADPYEYPLTNGDDYCSYGERKDSRNEEATK